MEKDEMIRVRIPKEKKELFLKALRQRKTTMSLWLRKQVDELVGQNT